MSPKKKAQETDAPSAEEATPQTETKVELQKTATADTIVLERAALKVKPVGSRQAEQKPMPALRAGTLFEDNGPSPDPALDADDDPPPAEVRKPLKKVIHPALEKARYPYATYRSAPADEKAEVEELATLSGHKPGKEVSTGFVLGIALLVFALLSGALIARLSNKVRVLEGRVNRLENAREVTRLASDSLP